jgi:hypothetical protein
VEAGVDHAQRLEDPTTEVVVEALTGDPFDQGPAHVGGHRVAPLRARLEEQRELAQAADHLVEVVGGHREVADLDPPVELVDRVRVLEPVGEPRGVGEEVVHRDRDGGGARLGRISGSAHPHLHVGQLRQPAAHGVVEQQVPLLEQHHQRHRGDGLGHRVDPVDRVGLHRRAGLDVGGAVAVAVDHLAPSGHGELHAGQLPLIDVAVHDVVDPGEAAGIELEIGGAHRHGSSRERSGDGAGLP